MRFSSSHRKRHPRTHSRAASIGDNKATSSPLALAHYYLKQLRQSNPGLQALPLKDFYYSSPEQHSLEATEIQADPYVQQESYHSEEIERAASTIENCCPECGVVIQPCRRAKIQHHLRQNHRVIVDLDYTRIASCGENVLPTSLSNPILNCDFDADKKEGCGHYGEDEDSDGDLETDQDEDIREAPTTQLTINTTSSCLLKMQ